MTQLTLIDLPTACEHCIEGVCQQSKGWCAPALGDTEEGLNRGH